MDRLILGNPDQAQHDEEALRFIDAFLSSNKQPRYVLGRNAYAGAVAHLVPITGFIDDYTDQKEHSGLPIVKSAAVPADALVLSASSLRPLTALRQLQARHLRCLDYFAFRRLSGLPLPQLMFNDGFAEDFAAHQQEYAWIYDRLADDTSKLAFRKLLSFRVTQDIVHLDGFTSREDQQYFEDFLGLRPEAETFIDVGGYDGYTSAEFIRHCPQYSSVHVFEPEPANYQACRKKLESHANVHIHNVGLSDQCGQVRLNPHGSASKLSDEGSVSIQLNRLDDLTDEIGIPSFIKVDVEGEETAVIAGATATIARHHPRLAICVYHTPSDFWKIPRRILSLHDGYRIHLRHYTESIYETVMFFS